MKSILVGNGINIQFGGNAYTNSYIMKRIICKAKLGEYRCVFDNTLSEDEILKFFNYFLEIANNIFEYKYSNVVKNIDIQEAINDFCERYKDIPKPILSPHLIMLEDWFLILYVYVLVYEDLLNEKFAFQGLERLILDGIYNQGKIQDIYINMNEKVRSFFRKFDNLFTLNYDNNLERLTEKSVFHLHGNFSELASSENEEYVLGHIRKSEGKSIVVKGMEHCYCNALLNYSGTLKLKEAEDNYRINIKMEKFVEQYQNCENVKDMLLELKLKNPGQYKIVKKKINNPNLKVLTEYYFSRLGSIEGELYILGMSPNNDDHIFKIINSNRKIDRVYFYYYMKKDREYLERYFDKSKYELLEVNDLWKQLDCYRQNSNHHYNSCLEIEKLIKKFNNFTNDRVSEKEIFDEINTISQEEMNRVCTLVKDFFKDRNLSHLLVNTEETEFYEGISYIGLQEGIMPVALYVIFVMKCTKEF